MTMPSNTSRQRQRLERAREGGDRWPRTEPADAPANAQNRRAGDKPKIDIFSCRQMECAVVSRALQPARNQISEARDRDRPGKHKGEARIEFALNVEEAAHARRIEHSRKRKAEAEDRASDERRQNPSRGHGTPNAFIEAAVIIPAMRKVATAAIDRGERRARPGDAAIEEEI